MNVAARIKNELERAHYGEAWHGPALRPTVEGVTAQTAAARPIPGAHTIWEIVRHLTVWLAEVRARLNRPAKDLPPAEDFPPVEAATDEAWKQALAALDEAHAQLRDAVGGLSEERLREKVGGAEYSCFVMLEGAIQHHAYHGGQIALLKKAAAG
jgi:DinB superfamily